MKVEDYIIESIKLYFRLNYIWAHENDIQRIYNDVLNGTHAFRIKYDECDRYDIHIKSESYKLVDYTHLDYRMLVEFSSDSDLISIDGGKRYQWNKREILFIDPVIIRDLKLKELGI